MANVKFLTGSKADIDNQIASGKIDSGDVIFTSDTDELIFMNPVSGKRIMKTKTQQDYVLTGTDLGGLKDGTVIAEGTTIDELLQLITRKAIPATYIAPVIKLTTDNELEYEVGEFVSAELQSQFIQNDAGALTAHSFLKNGTLLQTDNNVNSKYTHVFQADENIVTFESQASYEAGLIKNNNLDEASPENAIEAGIIKSEPVKYQGFRKLFGGTGSGDIPELNSAVIRNLNFQMLNPTNKTEFLIDVNPGEQHVIIAYPSSLEEIKEIAYIQMGDTEMAQSFTQSLVQVEGANGYVATEYRVYTYKTDAPIASKMTFKVTI